MSCAAPGCTAPAAGAFCSAHWNRLPHRIRALFKVRGSGAKYAALDWLAAHKPRHQVPA